MANTDRLAQALRTIFESDWSVDYGEEARAALAEYDALASLAPAAVDGDADTPPKGMEGRNWYAEYRVAQEHAEQIDDLCVANARALFRALRPGEPYDEIEREQSHDITCEAVNRICDTAAQVAALTAQCEVAEESLSIMHAQHKEESTRIDELTAQCEGLTKQNRILELKNRGTLANNLCPDHRDKQIGKPCLACTIETLQRKLDSAIAAGNGEGVA